MKKFFIVFATILACVLLLTSCSDNKITDLRFYVIERSKISNSMSDGEIVKASKNNGRLVFDGDDIDGYNWQNHTVRIKESSITSLGALTEEKGGSAIFKVDDTYAFVITIKDKLVYYGGFEHGTKNPSVPLQPYIQDIDRFSFKILFDSKYPDAGDSRSNESFYSFLNEFGLLSSKSN